MYPFHLIIKKCIAYYSVIITEYRLHNIEQVCSTAGVNPARDHCIKIRNLYRYLLNKNKNYS